jgi:hypothetical protein
VGGAERKSGGSTGDNGLCEPRLLQSTVSIFSSVIVCLSGLDRRGG